jgi:predicted dehydrogenase
MPEIRFGIIGCGALGLWHAEQLATLQGVVIAGLADPFLQNAERIRNQLNLRSSALYEDYRDLLDSGLDAVIIASPDALHASQVLDALAADLHVLCEKPLTFHPDEVDAVLSSQRETKRHVALTYPRRYAGDMRALCREIRSGRWGRVTSVMAYNAEDWVTPNLNTWRHNPQLCEGGFFYDASGHQLDAVLWMTGLKAVQVRARVEKRGLQVPIYASGEVLLEGDVPFTFTFVGDGRHWREQIAIHCEEADFVMQNLKAGVVTSRGVELPEPLEADETSTSAFVRLLRGEGANHSPVDQYLPLLRLTRAALRSSEIDAAVAL